MTLTNRRQAISVERTRPELRPCSLLMANLVTVLGGPSLLRAALFLGGRMRHLRFTSLPLPH